MDKRGPAATSKKRAGKTQLLRRPSFRSCHPHTAGELRFYSHKYTAGSESASAELFADAEFLNDGFVALGIVFLKVVKQATPLADQHEKTPARAMVFLVRLEVLRQVTNALAQKRDLDFWAACVRAMSTVLVNEGLLLLSG